MAVQVHKKTLLLKASMPGGGGGGRGGGMSGEGPCPSDSDCKRDPGNPYSPNFCPPCSPDWKEYYNIMFPHVPPACWRPDWPSGTLS